MAAPTIAGKAAYLAANVYWRGNLKTKLAGLGVGTSYNDIYYDGENCDFRVLDQTSDPTTWNPAIQRSYDEQDYYVNTVAVPAGSVQGFKNFTDGFLQDKLRTTSRSTAALASINAILANGSYVNANPGDDLTVNTFSREVAYALKTFVNAGRAGVSLNGTQIARRDLLFSWLLGHLDSWAAGTGPYCRPFMAGISVKEAINYITYVSPSSTATVLTKVLALAEYMWSTCWRENAGTWGVGQSMTYTDRATGQDATDLQTQPDLNMMYCPIFGWLWSKTGALIHRTRGDKILAGGTPVYSGNTQISGSFQGTPSNPVGKQIDQQMYWGPDYIAYAEVDVNPVTMSPINTTSVPVPVGSPKIYPVKVTFGGVNTDYTIGVPTSPLKRIFVCGWQYQSSLDHTLTFRSNLSTGGQTIYERKAGDGAQIQPQKKAFYVGEPGETVTVRSSAAIVDNTFYYYEAVSYELT